MKITKKIEEEKISVIKFTEEEMEALNLKENWKYSIEEVDGSIVLTPYVEMEIELDEMDKEVLMYMIRRSAEQDISINEVVESILEEMCEYWEK